MAGMAIRDMSRDGSAGRYMFDAVVERVSDAGMAGMAIRDMSRDRSAGKMFV
jgi:hypothetical protein